MGNLTAMREVGKMLESLLRLAKAILGHSWGRWAVIIIPLVLWLAGVPVIRLSYGALVVPFRAVQFHFSADRPDAQRLVHLTGLSTKRGAVTGYLDELGLWAVLRELRSEKLSLRHQAMALAIVWQESRFRFYAKNRAFSACGLYQLVAATGKAKDLAWWRCMDPVANTKAGTQLFQEIASVSSDDLGLSLRCAYLKHYYGGGHGCSTDPQAIWKSVGDRMLGEAVLYLKALQQIEAEHSRETTLDRLGRGGLPYLPLLLIVAVILLLRWRRLN